MKSIFKRLLAVSLALLLLPAIASCVGLAPDRLSRMNETDRAYALYDLPAQSLRDAYSFSVTEEMECTAKVDGETYAITDSTLYVCQDQNGPGRLEYYDNTYITRYGGTYGDAYE